MQRLRWIAPLAVLALAALLRFWALSRPDSLVFDELYYVRDAVSQLAHGFPTTWPDDDPAFGGERALAFSGHPSAIAHPPLGKWLIGIGVLLFGPDSGFGWRFSAAFAGVATVGVTMRLGWILSRSMWVACFAGLVLAIDGVHIVLSRVSLLDGFLTLFVALGALFLARDWRATSTASAISATPAVSATAAVSAVSARILWRRPWLTAAGVAFGAAAAVKWSGLYPLAAFLVLLTLGDLVRRLSASRASGVEDHETRRTRPVVRAFAQAATTAVIVLPVAALTYLSSWLGWIVNPGGQNRHDGEPWWESLWQWHIDAYAWHSTLSAPHPYQANPLSWPLDLRPTAMFSERWSDSVAVISPLPNPLVTWASVGALLLLAWVVGRAAYRSLRAHSYAPLRTRAVLVSAFVLTGYLSGWLPWVFTLSRSAVYQFYAVVMTPFAALALALVLASFAASTRSAWLMRGAGLHFSDDPGALQGRRIATTLVLGTALILSLLFWPLWIGMPVLDWFYRLHLWLPGWA